MSRSERPVQILPVGTLVVTRRAVSSPEGRVLHPAGAVGVVVRAPEDLQHSYRVRLPDGLEAPFGREALVTLVEHQRAIPRATGEASPAPVDYRRRLILRVVIGSRAYGLEREASDVDRRGVFLPRTDDVWSLAGVPPQIEHDATQEHYWELQRFLVLALKANPNALEALHSPLIETATPLGAELVALRGSFLSRLLFQTYSGYVASQFKKMQADLRNHGQVKWKHVMHLLRLLLSGVHALRHGEVLIHVGDRREELLAVRDGQVPWERTEQWRLQLQAEFAAAAEATRLPERPDYEAADAFLRRARRLALEEELP